MFISTISLSHLRTREEISAYMKERMTRFWYLPFLILLIVITMSFADIKLSFHPPTVEKISDVRQVLWDFRQQDILGQVLVLLAGVFGVIILFKEKGKK